MRRHANDPRARSAGFTLIEVLGVVLVTGLVLGVAIDFFSSLTRQVVRATESTREVRRAAALMDRIAADLEHTLLVKKPEDADPLSRPWLFVAESRYSLLGDQSGSDQIKFIRRDLPRSSYGPASDVAMVAYTLSRSEQTESFELRRWSTSELPAALDREFPPSDDPSSLLVVDDLRYFALRFLDDAGQWRDQWDSTQLVESSELPIAVQIEVALAAPEGSARARDAEHSEPIHYTRSVELPLRPLDLEALLHPGDPEDLAKRPGGNTSKLTVGECIDFTKIGVGKIPGFSASDIATLTELAQQNPEALFAPYAKVLRAHPSVNPDCRWTRRTGGG